MSVVIEVKNVVRTFKTERVIDNASFVLSSCGVSALVAPNGSGKTTLMSIIAGLMEPTEGRVLFSDGEGTSDVALLLAGDKNLYMKNTVMENLMYFAALNGYGRGDIQGDIDDVVSWFPELKALWRKTAESLSYGQKRLVSLASAVISRNRYLLVDEAVEGLDVANVERLVEALQKVSSRRSVLVSSHDLRFVSKVTDSVLFLSGGRFYVSPFIPRMSLETAIRNYSVRWRNEFSKWFAGFGCSPSEGVALDGEGGTVGGIQVPRIFRLGYRGLHRDTYAVHDVRFRSFFI